MLSFFGLRRKRFRYFFMMKILCGFCLNVKVNEATSPILAMGCDNKRVDQRYPRPVRRLSFPIESSTSEILRAIIEGG